MTNFYCEYLRLCCAAGLRVWLIDGKLQTVRLIKIRKDKNECWIGHALVSGGWLVVHIGAVHPSRFRVIPERLTAWPRPCGPNIQYDSVEESIQQRF